MRLRILGSAGAEFPDFRPPAFLIDDSLLLDAGTIGSVLTEEEQWQLRHIFITHTHLDHVRGIPALADNIIIKNLQHLVTIYATEQVVTALRNHLMNDIIWPDFTRLPSAEEPVMRYDIIHPGIPVKVNGYTLTAIEVNHTVPAVGYCLEGNGRRLIYTGDTGPTDEIWQYASGADALIVEVSFPNDQQPLALLTKHLCCSLLEKELAKIPVLPKRILITHPKPQYYGQIRREIEMLGIKQVELLRDGTIYDI
ncbi:3',5'-cyclic-nucleotide phosphodiesterase [Trichlorobacter ammonificans]|uniref:Ribonuclease BN, tRNA processing enzyme n=1 Tax=Trichlorobacter ammonificans TaxID=2916410 RepID=A0ABM9D8T4_9BACT|nr:3',5'-cyclic-nucleotide phosphodiesterase [Trichlorobacter ammonificans]CAH2031625.1 Ribonuclease BN, tRNA processing enzyme [Trichlorobacter ammonificans]